MATSVATSSQGGVNANMSTSSYMSTIVSQPVTAVPVITNTLAIAKSTIPTMSREQLLSTVFGKRGRVVSSIPSTVSLSDDVVLICENGHRCTTPVACLNEWCAICIMWHQLLRSDSKIVPIETEYMYGQRKFEFKCSHGHVFVSDARGRGCRVCRCIEQARACGAAISVYPGCKLMHEMTRIRCRCERVVHDPTCSNPGCVAIREHAIATNREFAIGCKNFITCGKDFYITEKRIKAGGSVLDCAANHWWEPTNREILVTVRTFEVLFDAVFDDTAPGIEFTGYNITLGVAFTHLKDKYPTKCIEAAREWCSANGVRFIVIPATIIESVKIAQFVSNEVYEHKIFDDSPTHMCRVIRTETNRCNDANKIFPKTLIERTNASPADPPMHGLCFIK